MVQLTRIYTRSGDKGQTSLGDGKRVVKHDLRVAAYGTVDEVNSVIGLVRLSTDAVPEIDAMLSRIQNDLFDLGADLCTPEQENPAYPPLRIVDAQVERLERDRCDERGTGAAEEFCATRRHARRSPSASRPDGFAPGGAADDRTGGA